MKTIGAAEAAARLGVKRETLYAYVSRGQLRRERQPGSRESTFDADQIEALASRNRRGGRAGALELVVASAITSLEDDRLRYRGRDAVDLAASTPFEAVAEWLWSADPAALVRRPRWPAPALGLPDLPPGADPINRMRLVVAALAAEDELRYVLEPAAVAAVGRRIITAMAAVMPALGRRPGRGTVASRLWPGLTAVRPTAGLVHVLDAALVLLADHELAVSTLAARVAASARADPYSVVSTGLGVMAGGLHGGAGRAVVALFEEVGEPGRAARVVGERLRDGGRLPGLGHKVYRDADPRAAVILDLLAGERLLFGRWAVVEAVRAIVDEHLDSFVNIDFAVGALAYGVGMAADAPEAMFSVARTAGWLAHAIEEYGEEPLRFRPRRLHRPP